MTDFAPTDRLSEVRLVEERPRRRTPEIQQELDVAMFDLSEENRFRPVVLGEARPPGPYALEIGMVERRLALRVLPVAGDPHELVLSISPLRGIIKDYFAICESYYDAVKRLPPSKIEAIDMGRRGIHDEGARVLAERLDGKVECDHDTCRRLFTVICALQFGG